ncbi:MAG TPA: 4-(cytidine 5'-diphospho)-2-C-methyl-D-erythritol kinase [Bacteroidetes bacterium]|nr:4-(cytidine 5'-diphospho)-2-C-methyl-D-erythritol kinase [Bacteroidota bacterium]
MTLFPNAKINIGLYVRAKRDDGYHNIESLFYPLGLKDALEFVVQEAEGKPDELKITGFESDCMMQENLVMKALTLMRKTFSIPPLRIHLHKAIPPGSGLGGGSSDAAFMLRYLNRYFKLGINDEGLADMALQIGSDCAFFIRNKPSFISGRGELIKESTLKLDGKYLLLVYPGIHINTGDAYRMVKPRDPGISLEEKINLPLAAWKNNIRNDFQDVIIKVHPLIGEIIERIYDYGALYCSMSGSGSAVFGIFDSLPVNYDQGYGHWTWKGKL